MKSKCLQAFFAVMIGATMLFTGCGGGDDDEGGGGSIVGTWNWSKLTVNGVSLNLLGNPQIQAGGSTVITPAWITQTAASAGLAGVSIAINATFNENGTLTLGGTITAQGQTQDLMGLVQNGLGEPIPPITWAENNGTLTITSQGVVTTFSSYSVSGSKLTVSASWAELQKLFSDAAGSQGMTEAQARAELEAAAAELGLTVDQIQNVSGTIEFTR